MAEQLNDGFVNFLNSKGFQPILLPKGGVLPPYIYILGAEGSSLFQFGSLNSVLPKKLGYTKNVTSPFGKSNISSKGGNLSVGFFKQLLEWFHLGQAQLDAGGSIEGNTEYRFDGVTTRLAEPIKILAALNDAGIAPAKFGEKILAEGKIYVAYEVLYATTVKLIKGGAIKGDFKIEVSANEIASANADAKAEGKNDEDSIYTEDRPVAFAFRLAQLLYEANKHEYALNWVKVSAAGFSEDEPERILAAKGQVLKVADKPSRS
ncbi:hypothetical protein [Rhodoplanes sp. Z2-YC6860]|uniref:hypothetical protein n=1 Tax=Rhodoplanes sp. Z2-YC6860 TaxID=674703 RepID=UPI0008331F06|nr:hypothetical protein [Rhodoplanes sp. Z2-YC6860]